MSVMEVDCICDAGSVSDKTKVIFRAVGTGPGSPQSVPGDPDNQPVHVRAFRSRVC